MKRFYTIYNNITHAFVMHIDGLSRARRIVSVWLESHRSLESSVTCVLLSGCKHGSLYLFCPICVYCPIRVWDVSRRSWSPAASGPPRPSTAILLAVDGPPGPVMAATDGPPLPQVVPSIFQSSIQFLE